MEIRIGIDPTLFSGGGFTLTWHGFFTFIAVATAVIIVAQMGRRQGMNVDAIYSVALWCIIGGIIGSRAMHVQDQWGYYSADPMRILQVWSGGISIIGAILGGFAVGAAYMTIRNHPRFLAFWDKYFRWLGEPTKAELPSVGRLADLTTPALLLAMMIGRVGDIINGEHFASATSLPWAVVYTHPETVALYANSFLANAEGIIARTPTHPAVVYEMLLDLAILGVVWFLRDRLRPDGMIFALYGGLYAIGRFFISFLRLDSDKIWDLNQAQLVCIIILIVVVPLLAYRAQLVRPGPRRPQTPQSPPRRRPTSTASRGGS
jgi:phosphatidylglycerol:prolipoprotein diacylglycerol transferase